MYFIGVDLGTSAVKLLLMDEEGKIVNIVSREYPLYFPHPGWSEQKPEDWWEQSKEGIRELVKDVDKSQVAGISFGGQMHGLVILDENDNVIRPAILWNDGRTAKQTDYLNTVIGKEKLSEYTANIAFAGFTAPKILWVKENEPDNFAKICKIMLPKDYLAYRLSGAFVSDYSDASGMLLMDVKNKCWSKEMAEICGISLEMLPELHESFDAVGTLKPEVAAELGLPETCKVVAGAGDNAAAAVGTGTVGDGMCNVSLGTSGTVFISSNKFGVDSHNALHAFAHADGHYHLMGCMLSAASCNKWWMDEIIRTKEYTKEQENITKLGENNVFFLPYLMGERSPHNNPDARGTFIGLTMDASRADMTQAVLEGVVYGLRDSLEVARSLGIEAQVDAVTKKTQYKNHKGGEWIDVDFENATQEASAKGKFVMGYADNGAVDDPKYYSHFTIHRINPDGSTSLLEYPEEGCTWSGTFKNGVDLDEGDYALVSGTRLANGGVLAEMQLFHVKQGATTQVDMNLRSSETEITVKGNFNSESKFILLPSNQEVSLLSQTGRGYFVTGMIGVGQEPTNHALKDIAKVAQVFEKWGRPIVILFEDEASAKKFRISEFPGLPKNIIFGIDKDGSCRKEMVENMKLQNKNLLPIFTISDTFNRVVFLSQGYTIGLGEQLESVIKRL